VRPTYRSRTPCAQRSSSQPNADSDSDSDSDRPETLVLRVFECRRVGVALRAFRPLFPGALFIPRANGSSRDEERDLGAESSLRATPTRLPRGDATAYLGELRFDARAERHRSHANLAAAVALAVLRSLARSLGIGIGFGFGLGIGFGFGSCGGATGDTERLRRRTKSARHGGDHLSRACSAQGSKRCSGGGPCDSLAWGRARGFGVSSPGRAGTRPRVALRAAVDCRGEGCRAAGAPRARAVAPGPLRAAASLAPCARSAD
jgi:hypothetical protein